MGENYKAIEFPPIPNNLSKLFDIENPLSPKIRDLMKKTKNHQVFLNNLCTEYENRISKHATKLTKCKSGPIVFQNEKKEIVFLRKKHAKASRKVYTISREIYTNCISLVQFVLSYLQFFIDNTIPVLFDEVQFKKYLESICADKYLTKYQFRKKSTKAKINFYKDTRLYPDYDAERIKAEIEVATSNFISQIEYCPYSHFDVIFHNHIDNSPRKVRVIQVAKSLVSEQFEQSKENKEKNNHLCNTVINELLDDIEVTDPTQKKVIRITVFRYVFDCLYTYSPILSLFNNDFTRNSILIQKLTPNELNLPKSFVKDDHRDTPLIDFLDHDQALGQIIKIISSLEFVLNIFDIAYILHEAIAMIQNYVNDNNNNAFIPLDFDNLFNIFISLLVANPPSNSEGIMTYVEQYSNKLPPLLKHSCMLLSAAVKYITNFRNEELSPGLSERINEINSKIK